jgi:hypothetical protein
MPAKVAIGIKLIIFCSHRVQVRREGLFNPPAADVGLIPRPLRRLKFFD